MRIHKLTYHKSEIITALARVPAPLEVLTIANCASNIQDTHIAKLAKGHRGLRDISLIGATAVTDRAVFSILKTCLDIAHVRITGTKESKGKTNGNFAGWFASGIEMARSIEGIYFEHQPLKQELLKMLSSKRPKIIIVEESICDLRASTKKGQPRPAHQAVRVYWRCGVRVDTSTQDSTKGSKRKRGKEEEVGAPRAAKMVKTPVAADESGSEYSLLYADLQDEKKNEKGNETEDEDIESIGSEGTSSEDDPQHSRQLQLTGTRRFAERRSRTWSHL